MVNENKNENTKKGQDKQEIALTYYILGFTFFVIGISNLVLMPSLMTFTILGVVFFIVATTMHPLNRIGELFEKKKPEASNQEDKDSSDKE